MSSIQTSAKDVLTIALGHKPPIPVLLPASRGNYRVAYVSGPMRGIESFNFPLFDSCRENLLYRGFAVISPADIDRVYGTDELPEFTEEVYNQSMRRDVALLTDPMVTDIVLLDHYERSAGATVELAVARALGLDIHRWSPNEKVAGLGRGFLRPLP